MCSIASTPAFDSRSTSPREPTVHLNVNSSPATIAATQVDDNSGQARVKVGEESVNPLKWGRAPNDEQMSHPARWLSPPRIPNEAPRSRHRRRFVASRDAATHRTTHQPRDRVELVVAPSTVKTHESKLHDEHLLAKTGRRDRIGLGELATTSTDPV